MEYLIKSSTILILFYVVYKLLLQKETFFQLNRIFFLFGILCTIAVPLIVIPIYIEPTTTLIPMHSSASETVIAKSTPVFNWMQILEYTYYIGVFFFVGKLLVSLTSLVYLLLKSTKTKKEDGIQLIESNDNISPFSFFNWIVYNPSHFNEEELEQIVTHEKVHVKQWHSIDILISQISTIVFWFHPFIWLYKKDLQQNLEFIADASSQEDITNKINYQKLLLRTFINTKQLELTNHFYSSFIKKRITMLHTKKSKKMNQWKLSLILPILVGFIFTFNTKVIARTSIETDEITEIRTIDSISSTDTTKFARIGLSNQEYVIEGKTNDEKGNPLSSVFVTIEGTSHGLLTNEFGGFAIKVRQGTVLKFSQPGRISQKTTVINSSPLSIALEKDPNFVDEIIETPIVQEEIIEVPLSQTKKPLIVIDGKLSFLTVEDLDENHIYSMTVLKGEKAKEKYGEKGAHGAIEITTKKKETITVIGYKKNDHKSVEVKSIEGNDPLIVIDGKISSKNINDIEPDQIESISVLKGQKAIDKYGEKGKEGVVEITTKKK